LLLLQAFGNGSDKNKIAVNVVIGEQQHSLRCKKNVIYKLSSSLAEADINLKAQGAANTAQIKALEPKSTLARLHLREAQDRDIEPQILPQFITHPKDQLNIMEGK
jgi:DNA-directed RNA polymerase